MRTPKYMSPTSIKKFYENRDKYYMEYLCDKPPAREPQTEPMGVGSAFDAFIKSFLVERLIGKRPEFEFNTIFESQVEPQNRDFCLKAGRNVFNAYSAQGALADLLLDLEGCVGLPQFETKIEGYVNSVNSTLGDVPLLGKPDIAFLTKKAKRVIFDWKVNGYCSNYNVSPKPGYVRLRTADRKDNGQQHAKAMVLAHGDIKVSVSHPLDCVDAEWAAQLAIYAWLLGEEIGSQFVVAIDQIACGNDGFGSKTFRIAQHRSLVNAQFQHDLFTKAQTAWYAIQRGHPFFELSKEENDARCKTLDGVAAAEQDSDFKEMLR